MQHPVVEGDPLSRVQAEAGMTASTHGRSQDRRLRDQAGAVGSGLDGPRLPLGYVPSQEARLAVLERPHCPPGLRSHQAVDRQPGGLLELLDRGLGAAPEDAVDRPRIVAELAQPLLEPGYVG